MSYHFEPEEVGVTDHWLDYEAFWREVQLYREFDYSWSDSLSTAHHHPDHDATKGYGGMTNAERIATAPSPGKTCAVEGYPLSLLQRGDALCKRDDEDETNDNSNVCLRTTQFTKRTADPAVDPLHGRCYTCCCVFVEGVVLGAAFESATAAELRFSLDDHNHAIALNSKSDVWRAYVDAGLGTRIDPIPEALEPDTYYVVQSNGHNFLIIDYDPETDLILTLEAAHRPELCNGAGTFGGVGHRGIGRAGAHPPEDWVLTLLDKYGPTGVDEFTWTKFRDDGIVCMVRLNMRVPKAGLGELRYPLGLATDGGRATAANADLLFRDTEQEHVGGYYPVGINTVWHGGLHLRAWRGAAVHAPAHGQVIAARLGPQSSAWGAWGSHNFVLTKHHYETFDFYMLFMHLDACDGQHALEELPWLDPARTGEATFAPTLDPVALEGDYVVGGDPNARLSANFSLWEFEVTPGAYRLHLGLLQHLQTLRERCGCAVSVTLTGSNGLFCNLTSSTPTLASLAAGLAAEHPELQASATAEGVTLILDVSALTCPVSDDLIAKLKQGQVIAPNVCVQAGDLLGWVGEYGKEHALEGQIHWEIFAPQNVSILLGDAWREVRDTDENFNVDCQAIMDLFAPHQQNGIWDSDALLSEEELVSFFQQGGAPAAELRRYATYFVSEWGIDLEVALEQLLSWEEWYTYDLEGKLRHYQWWDHALAAGAELPLSRHVWHFNPVAFLQDLYAKITAESED